MRTIYLLVVARQQLEDRCLWLADRLVDNGHLQKSPSLYLTVTQLVVHILEDMVDFFTKLILYFTIY